MPSLITRKARARPCQRPKRSLGFTLIEILVALVILSIGLLGIAALQLRSLQSSHASFERSIASLQARDLVERMWAGICTLHDANRNLVPNERDAILAAWRADHTSVNTFAGQGWSAVLSPPPTGTQAGTITISWSPRDRRVETERTEIVHHFILPPPLRHAGCTP